MRFEAAVSALLAAEFVTAEGAPSRRSVEETAQFRKQAVESIANLSPAQKGKSRSFQETLKHRNRRSLRDHGKVLLNRHVNELSRKLSDVASGQEQRKQSETSDNDPDFGVLASPSNKERSNQNHRNGRRLRDRGSALLNHEAKELSRKLSDVVSKQEVKQEQYKQKEGHSNAPDFGILASLPKKEGTKLDVFGSKFSGKLKNKKTSSDESSSNAKDAITDLGILPSISKNEKQNMIKNKVQKLKGSVDQILQKTDTSNDPESDRRLEEPGDDFLSDAAGELIGGMMGSLMSTPITYSVQAICLGLGSTMCDTCEVTDVDEKIYNVKTDCPNLSQEIVAGLGESIGELQNLCSDYGICESCTLNYENFQIDFQECTKGKLLENAPDEIQNYVGDDMGNGYLGEAMDYLADVIQTGPFASFGSMMCTEEEAASACETCDLTYEYDDSGEKTDMYALKLSCSNVPAEYAAEAAESFASLQNYCTKYNICETCNTDAEKFSVDVQGCNKANFFEAVMTGAFENDIVDEDENVDDIRDTVMDSIMENGPLASFGLFCADENADLFCNTCDLTYEYDDSGTKTNTYSLKMDCPDVPEEAKTDAILNLQYYCTAYNLCSTCSGNGEDFVFDFQDCNSEAFLAQLDPYSPEAIVQSIAFVFDGYFSNICSNSDCGECGVSSQDSSSFSFSINCPSRLSASKNGFGSYMGIAQAFCSSPEAQGVECSTCDVDPWAATINIADCVATGINLAEESTSSANSTGSTPSESTVIAPSDDEAFVFTYQRFCNSPEYYLQDSLGTPNCDCNFDEAAQTVSFDCLYSEVCREIDSYCPDYPLVFCDTYRVEASNSKSSAVKLNRCVNFTSPYDFSYCVSYGMNEASAAISDTKATGSRVCDMKVDGIQCNECFLQGNNWGAEAFGSLSVDVMYNCSNTVIGSNGPGNLSQYKLVDDTVSYFIYQSLPCFGGCDLCGVGSARAGYLDAKTNFMTKPDGKFSSEFWKSGEEERCFDAQLSSMSQLVLEDECLAMREKAREPCGCENPNPNPKSEKSRSGAYSFKPKPTSTAGVVLLTLGVASFVQMLF